MRARPLPSIGSTSYLPASTYQVRDQLDQLVAMLGGDIVVLGEVLGHVVELPARRIQLDERLGRDRLSERPPRLDKGGAGPRADRPPAVVIDRAVAEHLEVLRVLAGSAPSGSLNVWREADAVDRRLGDAPDRLAAAESQARPARSAPCRSRARTACAPRPRAMPFGPVDDERGRSRRRDTSPASSAGTACCPPTSSPTGSGCKCWARPARRWPSTVSSGSGTLLKNCVLVDRAGRPALRTGPVVGDHHDQRVVQLRRSASRKSISRPRWWSVWLRKPANTSIIRA